MIAGVPLVRLTGEVDHQCGAELHLAVQEALSPGGDQILIDLETCGYLDSAALSVLLRLVEDVRGRGWVGTIAPSRMVLRLFELVGLMRDPDFRVFASLSEARAALRGRDAADDSEKT
jgi:anti-anti-sigma factor